MPRLIPKMQHPGASRSVLKNSSGVGLLYLCLGLSKAVLFYYRHYILAIAVELSSAGVLAVRYIHAFDSG